MARYRGVHHSNSRDLKSNVVRIEVVKIQAELLMSLKGSKYRGVMVNYGWVMMNI
jgi:hypothetical protein